MTFCRNITKLVSFLDSTSPGCRGVARTMREPRLKDFAHKQEKLAGDIARTGDFAACTHQQKLKAFTIIGTSTAMLSGRGALSTAMVVKWPFTN